MLSLITHALNAAHAIVREHSKLITRSSKWGGVRKAALIANPKCACCGRKFNKKGNGLYVTFNNLIAVCDEDTHIVDNIGTVCDFCYADLDTATQMLKNIGLTVVKDHWKEL